MKRHFTATGFLVEGDRTLLHWHRKLNTWMPPGGHVEPDEEPIEALLREVREETGLEAEIVSEFGAFAFERPRQLPPPRVILLEDIDAGGEDAHQHVDLIYYCRPTGAAAEPLGAEKTWRWVRMAELQSVDGLELDGRRLPLADDIRVLGIDAIRLLGARVEC